MSEMNTGDVLILMMSCPYCKSYPSSGDFSHSPQHVFWTCSYQMDKSRDMSQKKNTGFLDVLKREWMGCQINFFY